MGIRKQRSIEDVVELIPFGRFHLMVCSSGHSHLYHKQLLSPQTLLTTHSYTRIGDVAHWPQHYCGCDGGQSADLRVAVRRRRVGAVQRTGGDASRCHLHGRDFRGPVLGSLGRPTRPAEWLFVEHWRHVLIRRFVLPLVKCEVCIALTSYNTRHLAHTLTPPPGTHDPLTPL
jgi:hypothetical protein